MDKINVNPDYVIFSQEEKNSAIRCLDNGDTSIFVGDVVSTFEQNLAHYLNVNYALALPNCTLSLYATLQSLEIEPEDEVIVPNLTHASSIYPIIMSGAKLKVCDFIPDSYNYDLNHLKSLISEKTKFMIACYLYGMPLNIQEVADFCKDNNIILIEDVAQAFGTKVNNSYAGTFGSVGCFSFNDTKMLRIGEGGAIVTNDKNIYKKIEHFRHVGEVFKSNMESSVSSNTTYGDLLFNGLSNKGRGLNLRPSPVTFSTGIERLKVIDDYISRRVKKLSIYVSELSKLDGVKIIENFKNEDIRGYAPIACWLVLDSKKYSRNKVILGCINMGIPTGSFNYNTIINNDYFNQYIKNKDDHLPNSQNIRDNSIFLPLYESLSENDILQICQAFKYVIENYNNNINIFNEKIYDEKISYFDGFYLMRR